MIEKRKRGRPMSAHDVSVTPEFREQPDIEKLGRVLIAIALDHAKRKEEAEETITTSITSLPETRKGM